MQLHAAVETLQGLSAEAAELQARLAELATPQGAPLPEAALSTLEHLARPRPLLMLVHVRHCLLKHVCKGVWQRHSTLLRIECLNCSCEWSKTYSMCSCGLYGMLFYQIVMYATHS